MPLDSQTADDIEYLLEQGVPAITLDGDRRERWPSGGAEEVTPDGTTVGDIADVLEPGRVVRLSPGTTYTHEDDTVSITYDGGGSGSSATDFDAAVEAEAAAVESRGTLVEVLETSVDSGRFRWSDGTILGSSSLGEFGFVATDAVWNVFEPSQVFDCEVGLLLRNEDLWCEYTTAHFRAEGCGMGVALAGGETTTAERPTGYTWDPPGNVDGTESFRNLDLDLDVSTPGDMTTAFDGALDTAYGVWSNDAKPYTSSLNVTVSMGSDPDGSGSGDDYVGYRHHGPGFNGSIFMYHDETPGDRSGGTAIVNDYLERQPPVFVVRVGGGPDTVVENNQTLPLVWEDAALDQSGANGRFGPNVQFDGELAEGWTTSFTDRADARSKEMQYTPAVLADPGEDLLRFYDASEGPPQSVHQVDYRDAANRLTYTHPTGADIQFGGGGTGFGLLLTYLSATNAGSSSDPAIEIGGNGAGLFVNGSGEVVVVDEAGNTTTVS